MRLWCVQSIGSSLVVQAGKGHRKMRKSEIPMTGESQKDKKAKKIRKTRKIFAFFEEVMAEAGIGKCKNPNSDA